MTAEVVNAALAERNHVSYAWQKAHICITIRDPNTGKNREFLYMSNFPHGFYEGLYKGDIIEFDYTEPSSWLKSMFSPPQIINVVAKKRNVTLEQLLAKTPKMKTNSGDTLLRRLLDSGRYENELTLKDSELTLKGSLKDVTKFVFNAVQDVTDFVYIEPHDRLQRIFRDTKYCKFDENDIFFNCSFYHGERKNFVTSFVDIWIEPADNLNVIVHVACSQEGGQKHSPSVSLQTLLSHIIDKLSQANRQ